MRSLTALALGLALVQSSSARVANGATTEASRVSTTGSGSVVVNWLDRLFRRKALATCFEDEYYEFVAKQTFGEQFCQAFMGYPAITSTVETTPITTTTNIFSTTIVTRQDVLHTTVVTTASTVTITPTPIAKRDALDANEIIQGFRREKEALNVTVIDTPQMSASFSSACDCQTYAGSTVLTTHTNAAQVVTANGFEKNTTTVTAVVTDAVITTVATVTASATSSAATATPTPTAPAFSCPSDNNSTVSQLVGNERFDYLVLCDTDLADEDFYNVLTYSSFSECAAACSVADARFDSPVCQGFSYFATNSAYNCFLKGTANRTVPAIGVDSAILQRIAVGLTDDMPAGTNTESAPFTDETQTMDPSQLSSSMSQFMANSSTSMPVITPGPVPIAGSGRPVIPGQTSYSTYISDGSTYSSGTVFSSYFSANGSWYFTYYTAFTQSWASATTVYASSETGSIISNSSNTETSTQPGNNGEYYTITVTNTTSYFPGGYNVTEVTSNVTLAQNGTQIASSAVTSYYSIATGGAGGGSGGSGAGGIGSSGAGIITGAGVTSASIFSTFTVISNGGQTGGSIGGAGSGVVQTPAPSVFATSGGTAFSSGFAASGVVSGVSGVVSGAGSGLVSPSVAPLSAISSTVIIGGTAFSSGFAASGGAGGISGASSTIVSGAILSSATAIPLSPISSTNVVGNTAFSSGFAASGVVSGTSGASSTALSGIAPSSGVLPSSGVSSSGVLPIPIFSTRAVTGTSGASSTAASGGSPFTNSNGNRSGTPSTTSSTSALSGALPTPIFSTGGVTGTGGASSTAASGSSPFTNSNGNRSGTLSTSSPTSSPSASLPGGPLNSTAAVPSGSAPVPSSSLGTGTFPLSTGLGGTTRVQSIPLPTGPVPYAYVPFTNSNGLRTYIPSGSSVPSGFVIASTLLPSSLFSTGPPLILTGTAPTSALVLSGSAPTSALVLSGSAPTSALVLTGTAPTSAPVLTGTAPTFVQSIPFPTGPVPYNYVPFTNSNGLRTYIPSGSSVPSGFVAASTLLPTGFSLSGTAVVPTGTAPVTISAGTGVIPSSGFPFSNSGLPRSGTLPSTGFAPTGTAPVLAPSGSLPLFSTGTAPTALPVGTGGVPSSGFPFSNSGLPRTGSLSLSTGTAPATLSPPYPTGASSCVPSFLGTTTIFTTVTQYGCYSNCPAQGAALTFGPPSAQTGGGGYY